MGTLTITRVGLVQKKIEALDSLPFDVTDIIISSEFIFISIKQTEYTSSSYPLGMAGMI